MYIYRCIKKYILVILIAISDITNVDDLEGVRTSLNKLQSKYRYLKQDMEDKTREKNNIDVAISKSEGML